MDFFKFISEFFISNQANFVINGFNTLLFLIGLVILIKAFRYLILIYREIQRFSKEYNSAQQLKEQLHSESFLRNYSNKGIIRKSFKILEDLSKTSMEDREKIVYLEDLSNSIRTAVPRAVPALSVVIGFFGTVVGLYLAINTMPDIFTENTFGNSEQSFQMLIDTMIKSLGAMSIAFGTTLVGLAISLILSMGNLLYKIYWDKFDQKFEEVLVLKIFPAFVAPNEETFTNILSEFAKASSTTMKTIVRSNENLLKSVDSLTLNMEKYNENNERVLRQVIEAVKSFSELQKGNQDVYESIKSIAQQAEQSYFRVEQLLDTNIQDREGFLAYLQDSRNEIKEISTIQHKSYVKTNDDFLDKQKGFFEGITNDFFERQNTIYKNQLSEFSSAYLKLQDNLNALQKELLTNIKEDNQIKVKEFINQSNKLHESLSTQLAKIGELIDKNITAKTINFTTGIKELNDLLKDFKAEVDKGYAHYGIETTKLIKELSGLVSKSIETHKIYVGGN